MSSGGGEDVPEELLWRGDVDDGSRGGLGYVGGDDDLGSLYGVMRRDTRESSFSFVGDDDDGEDGEEEDDPLGGLKTLGSMQTPIPVAGEKEQDKEQEEEEEEEAEEQEEDFVRILEASIQRDLPKYVCLFFFSV